MRVVVVAAWPPVGRVDGATLVLHAHLHHVADRHEITVLAPGSSTGPATLPERVRLRTFPARLRPAADYVLRRVASERSGEPAHVHYVERPALLDALASALRDADVLHLFGWGTAGLWRRSAGVPVLHMPVDPWAAGLANRLLPPWRALADAGQLAKVARHERRHYPHAGVVVVVAPQDADVLRAQVPGARIEAVPNGVEPGPPPAAPTREPVLGFHGAFETAANVDAALRLATDVLPRVRARRPDARLLLVGRDPPPALRRLAGPAVEVTGAVADVRRELDRVAVYVAAMTTGSGLKNKVLEAMAAGLPVVATPLALQGIGNGDGVALVGDAADELAGAAVELLANPLRRDALGAAGRARVERDFSWAASAAAIEALWHELAGR